MRMAQSILWLVAISASLPQRLIAGGFSDEPYLSRLFLAVDRASNYSDSAARLASAAYMGSSSDNPAGDAATSTIEADRGVPVAFTTINAFSESGGHISVAALTTTFRTAENDVISTELHYTKTFDSENREGLDGDLSGKEIVVGWSRSLHEDLAVGIRARLAGADIRHEALSADFGNQPLRYDTDQFGADFWAGIMGRVTERINAGMIVRLGWLETDTKIKNLISLGPIPKNTELERVKDDAQVRGLKFGLGFEFNPRVQFYTDVQYLGIFSNTAGSTEVARAMAGMDIQLSPLMKVLAGAAYDSESEFTMGLGLEIMPTTNTSLNISYQRNGAPEIENELGRVDYINASLAVLF